jgi:putative hydrolase of the HAD superfamily
MQSPAALDSRGAGRDHARVAVTTILFDAGGTLLFPGVRRIAAELAADGRGNVDLAVLARADADVRHALDRPEIIAATDDGQRFHRYLRALGRAAGIADISDAVLARLHAYHDVHNLWEEVPAGVVPALEALRGRYRMAVVSNANGTVRAKLEHVGLAGFFETVVDSHEEGFEKPDPRLFRVALQRMNARAEETVYVGDIYHVDVVGARAAGLRAILLDPYDLYGELPVTRIRALSELSRLVDS